MSALKEINYLWTDKKRTIFGLPISFTRYFVTENKVITRTGFLNIKEDELDIYKISDKSMKMSLSQRIFKLGTIVILSKDVDTPEKELKNIKFPRKVLNLISERIDEQRDRYSIRGRDMYGDVHHGAPPEHDADHFDEN